MFQTTVLTLMQELMQELMQRVVVIVFIFDFNSFFFICHNLYKAVQCFSNCKIG